MDKSGIKMPEVCIAIGDGGFSDSDIGEITRFVSAERLKRAERYMQRRDRNNCIVSYFLLRYELLKYCGISEVPPMEQDKYGKPYFKDMPLFFNISHSDEGVCCGIAAENIGVDIQSMERRYENILKNTMSANEIELITGSAAPHEEFTRLWTLKESIVKYRGTGIGDHIEQIDFSACSGDKFIHDGLIFRSERYGEYYVSACTSEREPEFVKKELSEYISEYQQLIKA